MGIAWMRFVTVAFPDDKSVFFVEYHQKGPQPYAFLR